VCLRGLSLSIWFAVGEKGAAIMSTDRPGTGDKSPATGATTAGSGVPAPRSTQEGYQEQAEYGRAGGRGAAEAGYPPQQAEYGRHEGPRAAAQGYPETAGYGPEGYRASRHRHLGMAATMMILSGLLTSFIGIVGILKGIFFASVAAYPFYFSPFGRGLTDLVIGAVVFFVGCGLLFRVQRARHLATAVVVVSAIANFIFLPFYPVWSIVVIALDIIIIWELTREARGMREFA
jgi:hypothetical protein